MEPASEFSRRDGMKRILSPAEEMLTGASHVPLGQFPLVPSRPLSSYPWETKKQRAYFCHRTCFVLSHLTGPLFSEEAVISCGWVVRWKMCSHEHRSQAGLQLCSLTSPELQIFRIPCCLGASATYYSSKVLHQEQHITPPGKLPLHSNSKHDQEFGGCLLKHRLRLRLH